MEKIQIAVSSFGSLEVENPADARSRRFIGNITCFISEQDDVLNEVESMLLSKGFPRLGNSEYIKLKDSLFSEPEPPAATVLQTEYDIMLLRCKDQELLIKAIISGDKMQALRKADGLYPHWRDRVNCLPTEWYKELEEQELWREEQARRASCRTKFDSPRESDDYFPVSWHEDTD